MNGMYVEKPILSIKTKNLIMKKAEAHCIEVSFSGVKNIIINGIKRGCSGFVKREDTGTWVYFTTEPSCSKSCNFMHRLAESDRDYHGGHNHFAQSVDEMAEHIVKLLVFGRECM